MPLHFLVLFYIRAILATQLCPPAEEGNSYQCLVTVNNTEERTVVLRRDDKVYAQCDLVKTDTDCHNVDNTDLTVGLDIRETNVTFEFRMANVTRDNDQAMWSVETYLDKEIPDVLFRFRTLVYVRLKDVQLNTTWSSKGLIVTIVVPVLTYQPTQIKLLHKTPKTASSCNNSNVGKTTPNFRSTCFISLDVDKPTTANLDFLLYPKISGLSEDEGVGYSKNITITIEEPNVKITNCSKPIKGQLVNCTCRLEVNSDVPTYISWSISSSFEVDTNINSTTVSFIWMENITYVDCSAINALGKLKWDRRNFQKTGQSNETVGTNSNLRIILGLILGLLVMFFVFLLRYFKDHIRNTCCRYENSSILKNRRINKIELTKLPQAEKEADGAIQIPQIQVSSLTIDIDETDKNRSIENGRTDKSKETVNDQCTSSRSEELHDDRIDCDYSFHEEENGMVTSPLLGDDETDTIIQIDSRQVNINQPPSLKEKDLNILIIGADASGKSLTGNSILMNESFKFSNDTSPCTITVQVDSATIGKQVVKVADTPGEITEQNVNKFLDVCKEGYHACLVVHRFGSRLHKTDHKGIKRYIKESFLSNFGIIIVTGGDTFMKEEADFKQWSRSQKGVFKNLYDMCGKRAILFDNKTRDQDKQRQQQMMLMGMIQRMNPQSISCIDILNTEVNHSIIC